MKHERHVHFWFSRQSLDALLWDLRGASALEFALVAPLLVVALLGMVDVGRALSDQMALGSLLRIGAQAAINGTDEETIERVMAGARSDASVSVSVGAPTCSCPEALAVPVSCYATCSGSAATAIQLRLDASKDFKGVFLPSISLSRSMQVQVR